ncbi:MAG: Rv1355c family protein [Mongoliitalea sp.]
MLFTETVPTSAYASHVILNLAKEDELVEYLALKNNSLVSVNDSILSQIKDLIKLQNPTNTISSSNLNKLAGDFLEKNGGEKYGNWVYYPWRNTLVHVLPEKEFAEVRTIRNKYKITAEEQMQLSRKKIGVVGLSVGQSVSLALALERSFGEIRIADFDTLELSNLNRLRAGLHYLGVKKTTIVQREIAEIDPYLQVTVFEEGLTEGNLDDFLTRNGSLDLLIDECDSLDMKLMMRERARAFRIPVLMDTSDRGMLDIERFDLEQDREIFHGLVEGLDYKGLKDLPMKEKIPVVLKITGLETLSTRMKASLLEVNQSITSWPQLASSVFLGGALGAHASRQLLLGKALKSGRYYVDFDEILQLNDISDVMLREERELNGQVDSTFNFSGNLKSAYLLIADELEQLLAFANLAPSGGNVQPWTWIFDAHGVLHLMHDQERSKALLDFKGTGSLIAFGAALENIRIWCADQGMEIRIHEQITSFEEVHIASIVFLTAPQKKEMLFQKESLFPYVSQRLTDRLNQGRKPIAANQLEELRGLIAGTGFHLEIFDREKSIQDLASINGKMDWVRMLNKEGYEDFLHEIRWNPEEAARLKDGIDLATFDFGTAEKALMKLISNRQAMDVIRKFKLGQGFTKISDDTFKSASAIAVLMGPKFTPQTYLTGGALLQRIWITANKMGISFQPVTAALFMFHRYFKGGQKDFTKFEGELIQSAFEDFNYLLGSKDKEPLFMFRLNMTDGKVVKSYRRPVSETLKIIPHV